MQLYHPSVSFCISDSVQTVSHTDDAESLTSIVLDALLRTVELSSYRAVDMVCRFF